MTDQITRALSPTKMSLTFSLKKMNQMSTPFYCKPGTAPKTVVRTQPPLLVVCDMALVPRLPKPTPLSSIMAPYVPIIFLTTPLSSIDDLNSASTRFLILQTGALAAQTFDIRRPCQQIYCLYAQRHPCRTTLLLRASRQIPDRQSTAPSPTTNNELTMWRHAELIVFLTVSRRT